MYTRAIATNQVSFIQGSMGCAPSTGARRHSDIDNLAALSCYTFDGGRMRPDLKRMAEAFPFLVPKEEPSTSSDGRTVNLIKLEGTIQTRYKGKRYNTPIIIRFPQDYPRVAPIVSVNPSKDMVIHKSHPFVHPESGLVVNYYLLEDWWYYGANLVNVVEQLRRDFCINPPLFAQTSQP